MDGFNFFRSYYEASKHLTDIEQGMFYKFIMEYMFENKEPEIDGALMGFWVLVKPTLDISKARSKASQTKSKSKQTEIKHKSNDNQNNIKQLSKSKQTEIKSETSPPTEKEKEKEKEVEKEVDIKSSLYEKFKKVLNEYFIEHQVNTFKSKLNYSIACKEFDKKWSRYEVVADAYVRYVKRNKSKAVRLDKFLIAYKEDSVKDIEYAQEQSKNTFRKPEPQVGSIGWLAQQQQEQANAIDVEVE